MKMRPVASDADSLIDRTSCVSPKSPSTVWGRSTLLGGMRRMLDWLSQNTDLVALFLAVLGLALGLFTVWLSVHQARLGAYTRMHEMLIAPETARGRRILFIAHDRNELPEPGDEAWDTINQSLAMYDT